MNNIGSLAKLATVPSIVVHNQGDAEIKCESNGGGSNGRTI